MLALFQVAAWIVGFLVADFTVDLQHAGVVLHHVVHDGAGESVLGVGVDVHLHHSIVECFADLFERRATAAVEDEIHLGVRAVLGGDGGLTILEDRWLELHRAGLVAAVHVAKGGGKHEAADPVKRFIDREHVLRGRVKLVIRHARSVVPVFFTTDDTSFDLENDF